MAQSNPEPPLDPSVRARHEQLVAVLGRRSGDQEPDEPYWDATSTTFQDEFRDRFADLVKTYTAPPTGSQDVDAKSTSKPTSS
jgi:hypothetical protein